MNNSPTTTYHPRNSSHARNQFTETDNRGQNRYKINPCHLINQLFAKPKRLIRPELNHRVILRFVIPPSCILGSRPAKKQEYPLVSIRIERVQDIPSLELGQTNWWDTNFKHQDIHPPRWFYSRRESDLTHAYRSTCHTTSPPPPSPCAHACVRDRFPEAAQRVPWYKGKTQERKQSVNRLTSSRLNGHLSTKTGLAGSQPPPHHSRPVSPDRYRVDKARYRG